MYIYIYIYIYISSQNQTSQAEEYGDFSLRLQVFHPSSMRVCSCVIPRLFDSDFADEVLLLLLLLLLFMYFVYT